MSLIRRRLLDDTIKKTASGNPIAVQSVARMRPGIKIFGRSTQDGTPSPDHPVPIVNAGEGGKITVYISGANLLDINHVNFRPSESTGLTAQLLDDGTIQVSGTPAKAYTTVCSDEPSLPAGTYFISGGEIADGKLYAQIMIETGDTTAFYINKSFTITGEEDMIYFSVQTGSGLSYVDDYKIKPMINFGDTALPWGPYRELQDLPIQISNGLPGIPVDSGGNYTDGNGQQWVCDEVDFERGVYVQRIKKGSILPENIISLMKSSDYGNYVTTDITDALRTTSESIALSDIFIGVSYDNRTQLVDTYRCFMEAVNAFAICFRFPVNSNIDNLSLAKNFFDEHDVSCTYVLATPIETPLSPSVLAAYAALRTYSPTTVVTNDAGAWMKLTYKTRKGLETDA